MPMDAGKGYYADLGRGTQGLPKLKSSIVWAAFSMTTVIFVTIGFFAARAGLSPPATAMAEPT